MSLQSSPATAEPRRALVLGATGAFGSHTVAALLKHGWRIRALTRDPETARRKTGPAMPIEWIKGDALDKASVVAAAEGADLIVHAVNPPAYRNWKATVLPMVDASIAAAEAVGARLLVPASVYNFAPNAGADLDENAPQRPATRKGKIRVEMEARLRAASARGVRVLVVRAGDFFGAGGASSALDWLVLRSRGRPTALFRPGPKDIPRAFAYLPDLGETAAALLDRADELGAFEVFHFRGDVLTPAQLLAALRRASGNARLPAFPFPWPLVRLMGLWNETMRELMEMRYLWRAPITLANGKLVAFLGEEPHTPLDTALREALGELCAAPSAPPRARNGTTAPPVLSNHAA
ncbi:MAG TPA: NmrA family NAD(P)-binding protein [Caulobacteraceae bacterium]|nr:NmrA family NAD(P)-binding protein [Caulobacteraceae bacterium]